MNSYTVCYFKKELIDIIYDEYQIKKAEFLTYDTLQKGYIIGEGYKYEGSYKKGYEPTGWTDLDGYEPSELVNRKRVNFYLVLISFNLIVKVKKEDRLTGLSCRGFQGPCISQDAWARQLNTAYGDEQENYDLLCDECYEAALEFWDEQWAEYYGSRGIGGYLK